MNIRLHNILWLVRREFMEHRRLVWAPWILGLVMIGLNIALAVSFLLGGPSGHIALDRNGQSATHALPQLRHSISIADAGDIGQAIALSMYTVLGLFAIALAASLFSYSLGCLFDERRDRSVLFWKSLPVTDTETVLAKLIVALGVIPVSWAIGALISGWLCVLAYAIPLSWSVPGVQTLFSQTHLTALTCLVIASLPAYLLTLAPVVGWVMLCSATARRHPALIALLVPGVFAVLGAMGWPNPVWNLLLGQIFPQNFFQGVLRISDTSQMGDSWSAMVWPVLQPLASLDLWLGVLCCAVCLSAAIWYRRRYTVLV